MAQDAWFVPDDFASIQAALCSEKVLDGHTVMVRPGTYHERIDFLGKAVVLASERGSASTVIDGGRSGSVVTFRNGECPSSVLKGFTVTNGLAHDALLTGGGIHCFHASPTVMDCIVTANLSAGALENGGGMLNDWHSSPMVISCRFSGNQGGMANISYSHPSVRDCVFSGNATNTMGAGMLNMGGSSPALDGCTFLRNTTGRYGGGLCNQGSSHPVLNNCLFLENAAFGDPLGGGGGVFNGSGSSPVLFNCLFVLNRTSGSGGGVWNLSGSPQLTCCTFSGNSAGVAGGAVCNEAAYPKLNSCILWNDEPGEISGNTGSTVSYSCVEGGCAGLSNLSGNPLFEDPRGHDFHLRHGDGLFGTSPCVDGGDPSLHPGFGTTRIDGTVDAGVVDMGYHYAGLDRLASEKMEKDTDWQLKASVHFQDIPVLYSKDRPLLLLGDEETIFDYTYDQCNEYDTPDMAAHAFRDLSGKVNLLATHFYNFRMVGDDFDSLYRDCNAVMLSMKDPYPQNYNDYSWLTAHWIMPGTNTVFALIHQEYNGGVHGEISGCTSAYFECLWGSITSAYSVNGGVSFIMPHQPNHLVLTVPYTYEPDVGSFVGMLQPKNIFFKDGYYYASFFVTGYQNEIPYRDLKPGMSLMRTNDISDPKKWRLWDGEDFRIEPVNPYLGGPFDPADHIPHPISYNTIRLKDLTFKYSTHLGKYHGVATDQINFWDGNGDCIDLETYSASTADDLFHWKPFSIFKVMERAYLLEPFPSLIDHDCPSDNFETIGETPHLYFSRVYGVPGPYKWLDRDLIRTSTRIVDGTFADAVFDASGFDYYGISTKNRPAIGNKFIELISEGINGIDCFAFLTDGAIRFDQRDDRMGFFVSPSGSRRSLPEFTAVIDPKVGVKESLLHFENSADYDNYIDFGEMYGAKPIPYSGGAIPLFGGYGLRLKNAPPTAAAAVLSLESSGPDRHLRCTASGMSDYDSDSVLPVMAFKVKKRGTSEFTYFARAIFPFEDGDAKLPLDPVENFGSGEDINDFLPHAVHHGTMPEFVEGKIGGAYRFNGTHWFLLQEGDGLELTSGKSMTIEFHLRLDDTYPRTVLSNNDSMDDEGETDHSFFYGIMARDGILTFYANPDGDDLNTVYVDTLREDFTGHLETDLFYHVVFVMNAEKGRLLSYVDGELRRAVPFDPSIPVVYHKMENRLLVGGSNNKDIESSGNPFKGVLDELRIYNHALPAGMIVAHAEGDYGVVSRKYLDFGDEWTCELTPADSRITGRTVESPPLMIDIKRYERDESVEFE